MSTKAQVKKIHVLKKLLRMDGHDYLSALGGFQNSEGMPAQSSTELTNSQAASLIDSLEKADNSQKGNSYHNEQPFEPRAGEAQRRFIRYLWLQVSRASSNIDKWMALDSFIRHKYHVEKLRFLPRSQVPKVIKALKEMAKRGTESGDRKK